MISPKLYKSSRAYNVFMKSLGYERGIDRFLRGISVEYSGRFHILDAGCGTGIMGLHFLERFPGSELMATDLEPNFLRATLANAESRQIEPHRIQVGIADISSPQHLTTMNRLARTLDDESFSIVCVGAVVGYARDTEDSLRQLIRLLKPGGILINLEMNETPAGRFVSRRYQYRNISLSRMQQVLQNEGCDVTSSRLNLRHFPAKLTRTAIIARKPTSSIRHDGTDDTGTPGSCRGRS